MSKKRNIVLITLDSVRADHCSFMGYHRKTTPTIDKMARKGLYFENAIAASVPTTASMVAVFTAEYPLLNSVPLVPNEWRKYVLSKITLPQVLSKIGYSTGAFHTNPAASEYFGLNKGFKEFQYLGMSAENLRHGMMLYRNILRFIKRLETWSYWEDYYHSTLNWIEKVEEPYFLWVLLTDTHVPYIPPRRFRKWGSKNILYLFYLNWKISRPRWSYVRNKPELLKEKERERLMDAYDSAIFYADTFIKRLWHDIRDIDPILIIHADHGEGFGEHGFYWHPPELYEELIHVPLVIYNADFKGKVERPVSLVSLAPTILELIEEKNEFLYKSLLNEDKNFVVAKVFDHGVRRIAIRMPDWKYIADSNGKRELYYLKEDPQEQNNLIEDELEIVTQLNIIVKNEIKKEIEIRRIQKCISRLKKV